MYVELKTILYDGENHYLQNPELDNLKTQIGSLKIRLATYKKLRDLELIIFEAIADSLEKSFPGETPLVLGEALKNWVSVMRYSAMAMMLNSSEFLQRRLLEWLAPVAAAHQLMAIETKIYQLLLSKLNQLLTKEELSLIFPFLEEAQKSLIAKKNNF